MKALTPLSIVALALMATLNPTAKPQQAGHPLQGPSIVSVSTDRSEQLRPGQEFKFQIQFDLAPHGYLRGEIRWVFENENQGPFTDSEQVFAHSVAGTTQLEDDKRSYSLSQPITTMMAGGKWKLIKITLGNVDQRSVPIARTVTFDIPQAHPVLLHLESPGTVEGGQQLVLTVKLDHYPERLPQQTKECDYSLSGTLHPSGVNGSAFPNGHPFPRLNAVEIIPEQLSYQLSAPFEPDMPIGPWQGDIYVSGRTKVRCDYEGKGTPCGLPTDSIDCPAPRLEGNFRFNFSVKADSGLVTPTSVAVTVNPSQVALLQLEADHLRTKVQRLRQQLSSDNTSASSALLQISVKEALTDLVATESSYKRKGMELSSISAVDAFFDDIRLNYEDVLKSLASASARQSQVNFRLERVTALLEGPKSETSNPSEAVFASILHNAKSYDAVATSQSMTANLEVITEPKGASIYIAKRGLAYELQDHVTDFRVENLERRVYLIKLHMPGCEDWERQVDAGENSSPFIEHRFVCKSGAR
jgi:hypothetical protein